jgi:hypothetical protein
MIDWKAIAKQMGLTHKEFEHEMLTVAAVLGAMAIDREGSDGITFKGADESGEITLMVFRSDKSHVIADTATPLH